MKPLFVFSLSALILLAGFASSFLINNSQQNYSPKEITCNTIHSSENQSSLNLVFIGEIQKSQEHANFVLTTEPFSEYRDRINIFNVEANPDCKLYKGIAILCDSSEVKRLGSLCPNDIIIVQKQESLAIRASSFNKVISLNENLPETALTHELGHAVANLAEEYVSNQNPPRTSENCQESCSSFNDLQESCSLSGCSQPNLLRSIDEGVMRTLESNNYGDFDKELMRKAISKVVEETPEVKKVLSPDSCKNTRSYLVEGEIENGIPKINSVSPITGCASTNNHDSEFSYNVKSDSGEKINEGSSIDSYAFTDGLASSGEMSGEIIEPERFSFVIDEISDTLEIVNNNDNSVVSSADTSELIIQQACRI